MQVLDEDVGQDKVLGLVSYPLSNLDPEKTIKLQLPLLPSLDTDRVKDKKDRGSLIVEVKLLTGGTFDSAVSSMQSNMQL